MRRLLPLVYGLAVAAAVAGACFAAQALALRRPTQGDLVAARAVSQMTVWRVVTGVEHIEGRKPVTTICVHAKHRFPGLPGRRWTALVASGDYRLAEVRGHVRSLVPLSSADAPDAGIAYALAGCPHFFARRLVQGFVANHRFALRSTTFRGRHVYSLPFRLGEGTVDLYVDRRTGDPLGARLHGHGVQGWSSLVIHTGETAIRLRRKVLRALPR